MTTARNRRQPFLARLLWGTPREHTRQLVHVRRVRHRTPGFTRPPVSPQVVEDFAVAAVLVAGLFLSGTLAR